MIVTIHQPNHMPWLGFFNKVYNADVYIVLDDCQFEKDSWANRSRIRTEAGLKYITVPVVKKGIDHTNVRDVRTAPINWKGRYLNLIRHNYMLAPHYDSIMPLINDIFSNEYEFIVQLNWRTIEMFMEYLGIHKRIVWSHECNITTLGSERNADLVNVVAGGSRERIYLSGPSGRNYIDMDGFDKYGIDVIYNDFKHPVYRQLYDPFIPYASTLDLIMNHDPVESLGIIKSGFRLH